MKRLLISIGALLIIFVMAPVTVDAQADIYGQVGAGMFYQDGHTKVGMFGGGDVNISYDEYKGLAIFTRLQVLYSKFDGSYQAGAAFMMTQKRLGIWRDVYIGFGPGYYYRVKGEAEDEQNLALRLNIGSDFLGNLGIDLGVDYIPSIPADLPDDDATTRWFFYGGINFYPRL